MKLFGDVVVHVISSCTWFQHVLLFDGRTRASSREKRRRPASSTILFYGAECKYPVIKDLVAELGWTWVEEGSRHADNCNLYWIDVANIQERFAKIQPWQRVNHFPGMPHIARKTRMAQNLDKMRRLYPVRDQSSPKARNFMSNAGRIQLLPQDMGVAKWFCRFQKPVWCKWLLKIGVHYQTGWGLSGLAFSIAQTSQSATEVVCFRAEEYFWLSASKMSHHQTVWWPSNTSLDRCSSIISNLTCEYMCSLPAANRCVCILCVFMDFKGHLFHISTHSLLTVSRWPRPVVYRRIRGSNCWQHEGAMHASHELCCK